MKSLSLRIFLSFWLALIAIVAAAIGVTVLYVGAREDLPHARNAVVAEAAAALAEGDAQGLRKWLAARGPDTGPRVFVFDQQGHELLGRPVEGRMVERFLHERMLHLGPPPPSPDGPGEGPPGGEHLRAREPPPTLIGRDGTVYRLLVLPQRPGPFGVLGLGQVRELVLLIALGITGLVSWLLARSITRPIDDLTVATQAFASGRLDAMPSPRTLARRDEVGRLAASFGDMGARIRELLASRERLLRDVSHELRSPLARIRLALGLARQPGSDVDQQLGRLERDTERLDALIGQVLSVTRLQAGSAALKRVETDLVGLVEGIARDADFEASAAGKSVECRVALDHWFAPVDPTWMASAVENVVRNALRHTADASVVQISAEASGDVLTVLVRDHGSGVPAADLVRIFEPFYRVASARERDSASEGLGLGLAITARVMAAHGGRVIARNAQGGGLEVELTLPRTPTGTGVSGAG